MRWKPDSLGLLVRPRVLTKAIVYPENSVHSEESQNFWQVAKRSTRLERFSVYNKPFKDIFKDLSLGNTEKDIGNCYVGVVTHYMVALHGTFHVIDKSNIQDMLTRVRKIYGNRANLRVSYVGLKFYKGMERDAGGNLLAVNPWNHTDKFIWFYPKNDIVSMGDIVRYESAHNGDLVLFSKAKGIVVKHKVLNKPRHYTTNSWTCKSLKLLNGNISGYIRFLPNRTFVVRKPNEPLPSEMLDGE